MTNQPFKNLIGAFAVGAALILLLPASASQASSADSSMGGALLAAHFKVRPASTDAQLRQLRNLPDHRFTVVKQDGETYYLFPDKSRGRLYAGDHWAYLAFVNNEKNNRLRRAGAFVFETNPSNRADNRRVVVWHDWSPFQQW
jgi:hypothetical protein